MIVAQMLFASVSHTALALMDITRPISMEPTAYLTQVRLSIRLIIISKNVADFAFYLKHVPASNVPHLTPGHFKGVTLETNFRMDQPPTV